LSANDFESVFYVYYLGLPRAVLFVAKVLSRSLFSWTRIFAELHFTFLAVKLFSLEGFFAADGFVFVLEPYEGIASRFFIGV
jgi:hypothetical protein